MGADQKKTAREKLPEYLATGARIHQQSRRCSALYLLVLEGCIYKAAIKEEYSRTNASQVDENEESLFPMRFAKL